MGLFGTWGALTQFWHWGAAGALVLAAAFLWFAPQARIIPFAPTLALVCIAAAAFMSGQASGFSDASARCKEAAVRATLAAREARIGELERQFKAAEQTASRWRDRAGVYEQAYAAEAKKVTDYEVELAKRPAGRRCLLGDDDLRGLR